MKSQRNLLGHLVVMTFLMSLVAGNALSASLKEQVEQSQRTRVSTITVQDHELFARKYVGGAAGIYEFVNNRTDEAQAICNFDKGRLPQNQAFIFNEISIGYSKDVTGVAGGTIYNTVAPAALVNSEFEIVQNGRTVVSLPTSSLLNPTSGGTSETSQYAQLGSLAYLSDDTQFTWAFKFADGQVIAAESGASTFSYVEVKLRGQRTIKK